MKRLLQIKIQNVRIAENNVRREVRGREIERREDGGGRFVAGLSQKRSIRLHQDAFVNNDKIICFSHL